ncbi:hypothetical protein A4S05_23530 [Nostoc sp. KVJ20]|uniref:hypothetical protein n=1 Tax=Nostoc sp. KVJ20 TaxID=457944 RepID=UPI00083E046B|nr:hypothetical protein [Nostoc sp. KVJ20]ODH02585.1 hypothetical protein A4S05_23530 [Nostoc sp. KVJ20]
MAKPERIRIDVWASLRPAIEAEIERTGLTAQEVVNIALADYFGLAPSGRVLSAKPSEATATTKSEAIVNDDDDYI